MSVRRVAKRTRAAGAGVLIALGVGLVLAGCGRDAKRRPGTPPRNVLLVTASSLRKDHLSAYMYLRPTSAWPSTEEERRQGRALSLDDLADQGVLFADASTNSPRPFPALCSLMSGTWSPVPSEPSDERPLEAAATTLAERFRDAGFQTAAFTGGLALRESRGLEQGFEQWTFRFADVAVLELARAWFQDPERDLEKPWFVWVHLSGGEPPHDPRGLPPLPGDVPGVLDFSRLYSNPSYTGAADGSLPYLARLERGEAIADEAERARLVDLYDGEVARVASGVRGLALCLRNLDEAGTQWNRTVFAFAGVQGIELGDSGPQAWGSDSLAPSVVGVPLILRHPPSLTGARVMAEPVGIEDLAPTLCDWFGLPPLEPGASGRDGRSLLALLDSYVKRPFDHRPAYAELRGQRPERALRTREHAIREVTRDGVSQVLVYDRVADPRERRDLAAERPELAAELAKALAEAAATPAKAP